MGGENLARAVSVVRPGGSSPRGRGKLTLDDPGHVMRGLIPAWAGKTTGEPVDARHTGAHPRVGGENPPGSSRRGSGGGSSPRGRGKQGSVLKVCAMIRLIPAWAGKTSAFDAARSARAAHPRVGGENPQESGWNLENQGSSPRGRGKLRRDTREAQGVRLIPAWAGKTTTRGATGP